jgi:hypothetical protein
LIKAQDRAMTEGAEGVTRSRSTDATRRKLLDGVLDLTGRLAPHAGLLVLRLPGRRRG